MLVENFRPGTMEKLGFGWEDLQPRFPRLIYAAVSGFGHTGPYSHRPAYDIVVQGMGGIMSLTGQPGGEPARVGTSLGDIVAGLFTTVGINAALASRESSGLGTKIDVSMLDSQVAILENAIARYAATGSVPGPLGTRHPSITPFAAFAAKDAHVIIAAGNDVLFRTLCTCLERPLLAEDSRFATNDLRTQHEAALRIELESTLRQRTAAAWLELLQQAGVPSGPINDVEQVLSDPQVRARNMLVRVEDPETGTQEMAGNPIKFSSHPDPETRGAVPALDGDRAAILREL